MSAAEQELIKSLKADLLSVERELKSVKDKLQRNVNDYKTKMKQQSAAFEEDRQKSFKKAKQASGKLQRRVNKKIKELRATDRALIGVPGLAAIDAQISMLESLFGQKKK